MPPCSPGLIRGTVFYVTIFSFSNWIWGTFPPPELPQNDVVSINRGVL